MRLIKIKEFWNREDPDLVFNNKFTKTGLSTYWKAMDASFRYNVLKRRDFLIRSSFRQLKAKNGSTGQGTGRHQDSRREQMEEDVSSHNHVITPTNRYQGHDKSSDQEPGEQGPHPHPMSVLFNDMQQFFTRHQAWRECDRSSFVDFHDKFLFKKLKR